MELQKFMNGVIYQSVYAVCALDVMMMTLEVPSRPVFLI